MKLAQITGRCLAVVLLGLSGILLAQDAPQPTFYVQDAIALPNQEVVVNIRTINIDMIVGVQFSVNWDTEALEYVGVENIALDGEVDKNFNVSKLDSGMIGYLEFDAGLTALVVPDSTILFSLRFRPLGGMASTNIGFSGNPVSIRASDEMNASVDVMIEPGVVDLGNLPTANRNVLAEDPRFTAAPNPFDKFTRIDYDLSYGGDAQLEVLDMKGRLVHHQSIRLVTGGGRLTLNAGLFPTAGAYVLRLRTERESLHRPVILSR